MTIVDQITLCRAILLEIQTGAGHPGGPITIDGYSLDDINEAVGILVEERLLQASPPGQVFEHSWASGRITVRGLEFIEAYRSDATVDSALRQTSKRRGKVDTLLEAIRFLAESLRVFGPG